LFYSQEADGILGMSRVSKGRRNENLFEPIFEVMYERSIIDKRTFSLCLGKNGGYLQIGGYDATGHFSNYVMWQPMLD